MKKKYNYTRQSSGKIGKRVPSVRDFFEYIKDSEGEGELDWILAGVTEN